MSKRSVLSDVSLSSKTEAISEPPSTPTRADLDNDLLIYDRTYDSPMRGEMRAVTIQMHHRKLSSHYEASSNIPTPITKLLLRSGQQLVDVGPDSVVEGREDLLRQVAEVYLNRCQVPSRGEETKTMSTYVPVQKTNPAILTRGSDMFGGVFPNNSVGLREVKTKRMKVDRRIEHSYMSALARFGPMVRSCKAFVSKNGFRACEFQCHVGKDCKYHSRLYYPLGDEICHNFPSVAEETRIGKKNHPTNQEGCGMEQRPLYRIADRHDDAVICQVMEHHTCSKPLSWSAHLH
jgi:hypothetical protein